MKKIIASILCTLGVMLFANSAFAIGTVAGAFLKHDNVVFRTSQVSAVGGYIDSTTATAKGNQIAVLDTTAAISTEGWVFAMNQAASDTSGVFCTLYVYDAPGSEDCESGTDSLFVAAQVSADGSTWVTAAAVAGQNLAGTTAAIESRIIQSGDATKAAYLGTLSANGAALLNGKPVWSYRYKARASATTEKVDSGSLHMWPYIRFVIGYPDAKVYKVAAKISHLQATQP